MDDSNNETVRTNTIVASAHISVNQSSMMTLQSNFGIGFKAWDAKATRGIAAQFGIHANELEALSIVYAYLDLKGWVHRGTNQQDIVNWSGARRRWQYKINRSIDDCVAQGVLQRIPVQGGLRLQITQKGLFVLEAWINKLNELNAILLQKRV